MLTKETPIEILRRTIERALFCDRYNAKRKDDKPGKVINELRNEDRETLKNLTSEETRRERPIYYGQ